MTDPDLIGLFIPPLERLGLSYMITGGVAAVIYGDPRFTRDIDLVLTLGRDDVGRFSGAFPSADFYLPPTEALTEEVGRKEGGHFNIIHRTTGLRADVYIAGDDPLHAWALDRRVRVQLDESAIQVAPAEYVIVRKLEYYRMSGSDRHLRDIAMMLRISDRAIDARQLDRWIRDRGLGAEFRSAQGFRVE